MVCMSFGDPCPSCKYPSCLTHILWYIDVIVIFTFYLLLYLGIFDTNYIIRERIKKSKLIFSKEQDFVKENTVFWNSQGYFILDMKISKFINYSTNMC
jgi:hypothetical protein